MAVLSLYGECEKQKYVKCTVGVSNK